ncbi:MAG: retroviral-like aspartic protease family protein [Myxococcota bacterium]
MRHAALIAIAAAGCVPHLGPARVRYGTPEVLPLVQPSTDARRWYLPMETDVLGPVVWFVDTGYTYTTCDDDLAAALGLELHGLVRIRGELGRVRAEKAVLPTMELGGHEIDRVVCQVRDLGSTSSLDDPDEVPIAGVLGMDVLRQFRLRFDPASGTVELDRPGDRPPLRWSDEGVVRLRRAGVRGLRARVPLEVQGQRVWPILDTGATNTYVDGGPLGLEPTYVLENVTVRGTGLGGSQIRRLLSYELDGVRVGGQALPTVTLIDRDRGWWEPGLLGLDLLSHFVQDYDFAHGRMQLIPTAPEPLPQFSSWWPPEDPPAARIRGGPVLATRPVGPSTDVSADSEITLP